MAAIPDQIIERIRESVDIVDVIGGHVGLKRSGKQFKGVCPFHDEKSPSFYVDPVRRSFKCFGCGAWGDVFDFVQKVEGVGFLASVRTLGARVGVALPDQSSGDVRRAEERERERESAYRVNAAAAELYRRLLTSASVGEVGRAYQLERGIDESVAESFQIGYAPAPEQAGWDTLVRELESRELPLDMAEQLGLVVRSPRGGSHYDRFRGRLMFPIIQPGGRVLGFSGRILPGFVDADDGQKAPKYVNSPESLLYKKSRTLFGLHVAGPKMREKGRSILVEGQVDVVAMHQRGYPETVAPLGTALTQHQCDIIARFATTVVLCFDGDQAGAKAAYAALPLLLQAGMDVRIAALDVESLAQQVGRGPSWMPTHGEDPDSTAPDLLNNLLERPQPAISWFVKRMVDKGAVQSIDAQAKALRALVPLLRAVRGRDARGDYANLAAEMLQIPARRIWTAVEGKEAAGAAEAPRQRYADRPNASGKGRNGNFKDRPGFKDRGPQRASGWSGDQRSAPAPDFASGFDGGFEDAVDPAIEAEFLGSTGDLGVNPTPAWDPLYAPGLGPNPTPRDFVPARELRGDRRPTRTNASSSQFPAGMPHSAAMRPVQPLPSGQASVTALLVDRPELARLAEREGVLDRVTDQRLNPILARVIRAALDGESIPSEGELLDLVDPGQHRLLHDRVFAHEYLEVEDPQSALTQGLVLCERDHLEREVRALEDHIAEARSRGAKDVSLTSRPSREAANRLYQRIGFEPRDTNVYRYTF